MLKDVGMTVPKSRETSICSKTGDEGNIYAARQGMRACNNNNMRNPIPKSRCRDGVTHVIIVACPHPLSCCIYISLIPCLAAYTCFSTFCTPFCFSWSCGMHVCNNEEMAFNYTEVLVDSCCSRSRRILGRF